jgi:hypothetical protein
LNTTEVSGAIVLENSRPLQTPKELVARLKLQATSETIEPFNAERARITNDRGLKVDSDHDMLPLERDQHLLTSPIKGFVVSTSTPPSPSETSKPDSPSLETRQNRKKV